MTTISFDEVQVGDKVRLTYEHPEYVTDQTFTVAYKRDFGKDRVLGYAEGASFIVHGAWLKADATIALLERPEPEAVPGMVWRSAPGGVYVTLPGDKAYVHHCSIGEYGGKSLAWKGVPEDATVLFDPRGAKALPNPLKPGIKVGDRVRRENPNGVTIEFEVHRVSGDMIYPRYGVDPKDRDPGFGYRADTFEVVDREVPDRLPAGAILRSKTPSHPLYLRTEPGWIALESGYEGKTVRLEDELLSGSVEAIYLP